MLRCNAGMYTHQANSLFKWRARRAQGVRFCIGFYNNRNVIFCKIWDLQGVNYEERRLLGYYAVWLLSEQTFRRSASIIGVTRIDELGTSLATTSNRKTLRRNTMWEFSHCISLQRSWYAALGHKGNRCFTFKYNSNSKYVYCLFFLFFKEIYIYGNLFTNNFEPFVRILQKSLRTSYH
jgi:hypothetical protein